MFTLTFTTDPDPFVPFPEEEIQRTLKKMLIDLEPRFNLKINEGPLFNDDGKIVGRWLYVPENRVTERIKDAARELDGAMTSAHPAPGPTPKVVLGDEQ